MLLKKFHPILVSLILIAASVPAFAQTQTQYDKGTPPQHTTGVSSLGSYATTELGTVNLSNGSLNFKIPLGNVGGRGITIPLTLNYSSKVWSGSKDTDTDQTGAEKSVAYADYDRGSDWVDQDVEEEFADEKPAKAKESSKKAAAEEASAD